MRIAIDAMGGDYGLDVIIPAVAHIKKYNYETITFILVGDKAQILEKLAQHHLTADENLIVHHASEVIGMDESPLVAMRTKKDSSMRVALDLVKNNFADACVSAGNTGALVAIAKFVLHTLPGIARAAILAPIPNQANNMVNMLDLGANVTCTSENLYQFGVLGSTYAKYVHGISNPKVALLNIGAEAIKGTEAIREASELLKGNPDINYVGFIEGNDIFSGSVDVIVCDGFAGNIALKTSEGLCHFFAINLKKEFTQNWYRKLLGKIVSPILQNFKKILDPKEYNGATIIGLDGIVVKSHGGADKFAFANAIRHTIQAVKMDIISKLKQNC